MWLSGVASHYRSLTYRMHRRPMMYYLKGICFHTRTSSVLDGSVRFIATITAIAHVSLNYTVHSSCYTIATYMSMGAIAKVM